MQLAYVILVPDEVHNFMRRVQAELYERYEGSMTTLSLEPHVTIKQPFEADSVEPYERYLDRLATEAEPFELVTRGYGFFEGEGVAFVDVEQDPSLLALQHALLDELGLEPGIYESGEPVPYYFHGTLITGLSPDHLADARSRLSDTPEFRFPLQRFGLFRSEDSIHNGLRPGGAMGAREARTQAARVSGHTGAAEDAASRRSSAAQGLNGHCESGPRDETWRLYKRVKLIRA